MRDTQTSDGFVLTRWIGLAMVLPAIVAVALLGKDALMVVEKINENSLRREKASLERGLKLLGELNASEVLAQSLQTDAFRKVVLVKDQEWMRKNLGTASLSPEGVQQLLIVDAKGNAIFSSVEDGEPDAQRTAGLLAAAAAPMERARELYRVARAAMHGLSHRVPSSMTDGLFVNEIVKIDGRPAMITVAPFASAEALSPDGQAEPTLLIGLQFMTDRVLHKLGALSHVDGLRHAAPAPSPSMAKLNHRHPIVDSGGNVVTHVTWDFSSPGYAILKAALPAITLSLALIAALSLVAAFTMRRITQRLSDSERAAVYSSRHDAATGLANRGWFMRVFEDYLWPRDAKSQTVSVMLIDCDYFKSVNDTLGHAAGDAVLAAIADRLRSLSGRTYIAARLGGDEFAVVSAPLADAADAQTLGEDIKDALAVPVLFDSYVIMVSVSIGVVVLETPSTLTIDTWLARADMALYRAKRDGRGCVRIYDAAQDAGGPVLNQSTRSPLNNRRGSSATEQAA
jgi:diguanylate cyclase (GGDEF)-like protein